MENSTFARYKSVCMGKEVAISQKNFRAVIRYRKIQEQYHDMYVVQRIREDDVLNKLEMDYNVSQARIKRILNLVLPSPQEVEQFIARTKPKALQLYLNM